jgi:hypothetical protein
MQGVFDVWLGLFVNGFTCFEKKMDLMLSFLELHVVFENGVLKIMLEIQILKWVCVKEWLLVILFKGKELHASF